MAALSRPKAFIVERSPARPLALLLVALLAACDKTVTLPVKLPVTPPIVQPPVEPPKPTEPDFAPSTVAGFTAYCAYADAQLGKEEVQDAITLSVRAGSTGSDSKDATYTPPAGWVVVSHQVVELSKFGIVSFAVDTVPAGWNFSTTETVASTYSALIDAAAQKGWAKYAAHLKLEQNDVTNDFRAVQSSHHALHMHATAKGRGLFQGGSAGQFLVKAKLRYTGVDNLLEGLKACHEAQLK